MKHIGEIPKTSLTGIVIRMALPALMLSAVSMHAQAAPARHNGTLAPSQLPAADIAKFVYPANAVATPGKMVFTPDGESYLKLEDNGRKIVRYETATGKAADTVLDTSHTRENSIAEIKDFSISPDGSKLLVYSDSEPVYRRSMRAAYYVFEIKRNILRPLSKTFGKQQAPVFSPDGRMIAFVVDNNIYIKKTDYDSEVQVTTDGVRNSIINGIPDWTYEEEFGTNCSMTWAPDNSTLCFLRYDEAQVPMFSFSLYEGWCEPNADYALYPGEFTYKYPVAGEPNSRVSVHSYDVETRKTKQISLPDPQIEYVPRIAYGTAENAPLMVVTLNRAQNRMEVYAANPKSTVVKSVLVEQADKGWLNTTAYENISFGNDGFVVFSERSGWNHLYKYSYTGQLLRQITSGDYEVTAYYGEDAAGYTYFQSEPNASTASTPSNALNRVVYRVDRQGKKLENLTETQGWGSAEFSPLRNYYITSYSNAHTPPVYPLYNSKGKRQRVLESNASYASGY
ncbi:MAG: DPP IV N-terminal domain-containing protein, partial [Muribaculaceae bacterium]|nr:DPP IV N-terminal domain-containing protein [Muribaculaceae bacterium]